MHICESLSVNCVRLIEDEPLRFFHIAREEGTRVTHTIQSSFDALDASMCQ